MKELLMHHPWIGTSSKGVIGTSIPLALLQWSNAAVAWHPFAAVLAGIILLITFANVILEFLHKWRRDKRERHGL